MPFAFIRRPRAKASLKGTLQIHAGTTHATSFAKKLTMRIMMVEIDKGPESLIAFRFTLNAVMVMKSGINKPETKESSLSTRADPSGGPSGIANPRIKGPKIGNSPIQ